MEKNLKRFVTQTSMKLKLKDVINASTALGEIAGTKLPVLVSFQFSLFLKGLAPIFDSYNESRLKLLKEFGTFNKEKNEYDFKEGERKKYEKKYIELVEADVDIKVPEIKLVDLGDTKIEPAMLENITWLFKQ